MEHNPYKTPKSNLHIESEFKRSIWWKVYFFVITVLSALGMISFLFFPEAGISEYVMLGSWLVTTTGLFGFVFLKKIYKPSLWLPLLIVSIIYTFIYYFITDIDLRMGMTDLEYYISTGFGWLISLPGYYGLYSYSRPNDPAWDNA